jgi:FtsH-binding integral membrane protein
VTRALTKIDNFAGIAIFTLYMMMDTHLAIKNYEDGYADHLGVSIEFVLNAWNIFVRVLELLNGDSDRRRRK